MRLTDILQPDAVKIPLVAASKQEAIFELCDVLCDAEGMDAKDALRTAVWKREMTRTTGIGHGIAIPHGKIDGCKRLCMALGKPAKPLEFGAIDKRPVEIIILLASPMDQTGPHIQALAHISRLLTEEDFRHALRGAPSAEQAYQLIADQEAKALA